MGRATDPRVPPSLGAGASVAGVVLCFLRTGCCLSSAALCGYNAHGEDSSCCLRAAPRRPRHAIRRARARAPAPCGKCAGGSRRLTRAQAGYRTLQCFSFSSVAGRRSSSLSRAFSLVVASCGAGPHQRASRRATRKRCARRACVTGGSRRRSRARTSRVWCSLLLSSPLFFSRSVAPRAALP